MKKVLLGLIIGLVIALPVGAFAWARHQEARPLIGFDCDGPYYWTKDGEWYADSHGNKLPENAQPIPNPKSHDGRCSGTVYVFDDSGNKCYVAKGSNSSGISCVKEK